MLRETLPIYFVPLHHLSSRATFREPRPEYADHFAVLSNLAGDELTNRVDLHPVGAPTELSRGCRISLSEQIHPKCLPRVWRDRRCRYWQPRLERSGLDTRKRFSDEP